MLEPEVLDGYLAPLTSDQVECIRVIRSEIFEIVPGLVEEIDAGKWFGGLLTYTSADGHFVYALGPRSGGETTFHMMPYYSSKELKERNGDAFKKVATGKSCIQFKTTKEIPMEAIQDVLRSTPKYFVIAREFAEKRKKKR